MKKVRFFLTFFMFLDIIMCIFYISSCFQMSVDVDKSASTPELTNVQQNEKVENINSSIDQKKEEEKVAEQTQEGVDAVLMTAG